MNQRTFSPKATPAGCVRVLFRCSVKGCKTCHAKDVPFRMAPAFIAGAPPRQVIDAAAMTLATLESRCTKHPSAFPNSAQVQGTLSAAFQCDPRCTSATGPVCVCSCGGANHGAGWL